MEREASAFPEPAPVETDLRIDVVDPDDLPLPGAVVTLLRANGHGDLELSETVARTDSSGRARFEAEVLRSFEELHVLVDHPDFALHVGPLYWEGEPEEVASVRLHPAATFRGQVVENGTGTPVAGARLVIVEFGVYEDLAPGSPVEVVTDHDGRFEKTRVPDDDLAVTVLRRGFSFFHTVVMRVDFLGVEHRLVVPRGTTIRGRVVDGVTGAPLGDVELEPDTGVRTDLEGRFSVAGHPTDGGALLATRPGYAPTVIVGGAPGADGVVELVVPLFPESVISGVVLDDRGEPVEGVEVEFEHEGDLAKWFAIPERYPNFDWERLWVKDPGPYPLPRTGGDGRFRLRLKPISDAVRVTATDEVGRRVFTHPPIALTAAGSESFIELRPHETGAITGKVEPSCEGWSVELVRDGSRDSVASIDPDGTFAFDRVLTGSVAIRLWQGERRLDERDVLVCAGETSSLRFVVDRGPQGAIAGIVRRPDGSPLAGATVRASEPVGETRKGKTDAGGRFRVALHAHPGEEVRVECSFDGLERATIASLGEEGLILVLPETRPTHLSVVDHESGESVGGFIVRWRWLDDSSAEPLEGASKFEPAIEQDEPPLSLPVGVVSLTIDASWIGYEPLTVDRLEVPAGGGVLSHEYRLRRTAATGGEEAPPAAASDE